MYVISVQSNSHLKEFSDLLMEVNTKASVSVNYFDTQRKNYCILEGN